MTDKNDKTLSEILFAFNNRIVAIKDIIKKAKIFQNTKIVRQIKLLAKKKGNEIQLEKNKRKCQHLKEEIDFIKKQKFNDVAIFAFDNDETTFDQFIKANNKNLSMEKIALARVAFSKPIQKAIDEIKNDPKIPNWKEIFIKYKARCEKRKNWKEKNRLLKEIESKLKPENEESDHEKLENMAENSTQPPLINVPMDENISLEKTIEEKSVENNLTEANDSDLSEGYDSHDDDKWNEQEDDDSTSEEEESIDLSDKFVFSKANLETEEKTQEKNLKPLVIGEKPSHMVIKQINLDEVKDFDELPLGENCHKIEHNSLETLKVVEDPFFLDQNGNEIQGNDNFRSTRNSFDFEPISYSSYDKYRRNGNDYRDKRREMGRNSFKNSLSNDSRPFRRERNFDREDNFKKYDRPLDNKRKFEYKKNFDNKPKEDISKLHPSWQAKKLAEEKVKSMKFEGKKIKFNDDE